MKVTQLSAFLGLLAISVAAQETTTTTAEVAVVAALQPEAGGTVNGAGDFPVPVEMVQKRSHRAEPVKGSSNNLTKRHYGTFTCTTSLNNYCKQFLSQDGVGGLVGCESGTCYVGCGTSGYTRTNDVNNICVNYSTDENNCGSSGTVCAAVTNGTPLCNSGTCSATCNNGYTLTSGGQCINTANDVNNCGTAGNVCKLGTGQASVACSGGACVAASCATGYTFSSGTCVNAYLSDPANCGSAGNNCATKAGAGVNTATCSNGVCSITCKTGYTATNGVCTNAYLSDPANCGSAGNNCATKAGAGVNTATCSNGACSITCKTGYTATNGVCVNAYLSDPANCGSAGNNCATKAGAGVNTATCSNGACSITCKTGYTATNGVCTNAYLSDPANCGSAGNNCATNAGTGLASATCSNGACSVTCNTGYTASNGVCTATCKDGSVLVNGKCGRITACTTNADCIAGTGSSSSYCYLSSDGNACFQGSSNSAGMPTGSSCGWSSSASGDDNSCATGLVCLNHVCTPTTTNDPNNCGKAGNVCPTPANGSRSCSSGTCAISCNTGFTVSGTTCVNTSTDPNNCGTAGTKCAATGTGVASSSCVSGGCQVTCSSGYTLSSDKKSCSTTCADGSTFNGSTCVRYSCTTNAQCQSQTGRTDSACYQGSCFTQSTNTGGRSAGSSCGTSSVSNGDDNQCAVGLVCVYNTCYDANNPSSCGASQVKCPVPTNGAATCTLGTCGVTCKTGYSVNSAGTGCVLSPSAKSKKKRAAPKAELCPKGESACPITGSASFGAFVNSSDRVKDFAHSLGGYECIDTGSDLQSCGGCASLGTGQDCTRISHASEVGCSNGKCVLFGCRKGWVPALGEQTCVKVEDSHKQRSSHLRQRALRRKDISH